MITLSRISQIQAIRFLAPLALVACSGGAPRAEPGVREELYACEGCEATLEVDAKNLSWSTRIGEVEEPGEPLVLTGTVFQSDGRTAAAGVMIYAHQTDATGMYPGGGPDLPGSARDGRLRAWVTTGEDGRYRFETIKPAPYPAMTMPAHIHLYVREPERRPYYIDDVVFAGEMLVDDAYRSRQELRGGSGIVTLERDPEGRWLARRNIVLERHP